MFRRLFLGTIALISIAPLSYASISRAPTQSGDYCLDQGLDYLETRFGSDHRIVFEYTIGAYPVNYNKLLYAFSIKTLCDGKFYLSTGAGVDINNCTSVHYGKVPQKFVGISADGQCQKFFPRPERIKTSFSDPLALDPTDT
ncbi:MAG: hypothetical protein KDD35_09505 [Bdellovibrionales bacterium]|nr:hypothetical protein [Bdellovibrionales bacterium]